VTKVISLQPRAAANTKNASTAGRRASNSHEQPVDLPVVSNYAGVATDYLP